MQQIKYLPYLYLLIHIFAIRITWLMARTSLLFSSNPILRHHNGQIYILFDSWFFPMCVYVCAYVCVCAWVRVCVCVCMRVCVTCTLYLVENNAVFNWVTEVVLDVGTFWADHTNTSWGEQFLSRLLLLLSLFPYPTLPSWHLRVLQSPPYQQVSCDAMPECSYRVLFLAFLKIIQNSSREMYPPIWRHIKKN